MQHYGRTTILTQGAIIKATDFNECLRFLENGADITEDINDNIIYIVQSFKNKATEIVFYSVNGHFIDGEIQKDMTLRKVLTKSLNKKKAKALVLDAS